MKKSILMASLIAVVALAACGKKEEVAAPAPAATPMAAAASEMAGAASEMAGAASAVAGAASEMAAAASK